MANPMMFMMIAGAGMSAMKARQTNKAISRSMEINAARNAQTRQMLLERTHSLTQKAASQTFFEQYKLERKAKQLRGRITALAAEGRGGRTFAQLADQVRTEELISKDVAGRNLESAWEGFRDDYMAGALSSDAQLESVQAKLMASSENVGMSAVMGGVSGAMMGSSMAGEGGTWSDLFKNLGLGTGLKTTV